MKLIDLLVEELPKRGGWPDGAKHAWCDPDGEIRFREGTGKPDFYPKFEVDFERCIPSTHYEDDPYYIITREQYEAALAASQKVEWDGAGLPPVGCEFEMAYYLSNDWKKCVLIAHGEEQIIFKYDGEREFSGHRSNYQFRPLTIRSEADKKRDEAQKAIAESLFNDGDMNTSEALRLATFVYGAISRKEIPGVRIE